MCKTGQPRDGISDIRTALVNMLAAVGNKLGLPVSHLNVSQAFVWALLEEEIEICVSLQGCETTHVSVLSKTGQ